MANRTTFSMMGLNDLFDTDAPKPHAKGTIFHVLTESPSIKDYTAFGPFECIEATVPSIVKKLELMSPPALPAFREVLPQWNCGRILQFKAPLGDGNHMLIRLIEEHNPSVAAALSGPAWVVRKHEIDVREEDVTEFCVVGSYLQKDRAFEAVRSTMSALLADQPGARKAEQLNGSGGLVIAAIVNDIAWTVEAAFDSGVSPDAHGDGQTPGSKANSQCASCGAGSGENGDPLKRCSRCKQVVYYGQPCQKADYKRHKRVCCLGL